MNGQTVAILENRLGAQIVELIAKRGGKPMHAPALSEIPDLDPAYITKLIGDWEAAPVKAAIFQTGVGTRALFKATDELGLSERLLALLSACTVVVRGPKPTGALNSRGVRIDRVAGDPYTTAEVIGELGSLSLQGERVVVQRYGGRNIELENWLQGQGATGQFRNVLTLWVGTEGIQLRLQLLFRINSPDLFVPWTEITVTRGRQLFFNYIELKFRQAPDIPLRMYGEAAERVCAAADEHWPEKKSVLAAPV